MLKFRKRYSKNYFFEIRHQKSLTQSVIVIDLGKHFELIRQCCFYQ